MKYILLTIIIILGCVGTGIVAGFTARHYYVNIKRYQCILIGVGVVVIEFGMCFLSFIMSDYDAEREAYNYLNDSDTVDVSKEDYGYFFDGDGKKDAIIFYPGANVEIEAYAPLMYMLAEEGIDAFLISMPLKLPLYGKNKGEEIINKYPGTLIASTSRSPPFIISTVQDCSYRMASNLSIHNLSSF